jgi:hypothetical protein
MRSSFLQYYAGEAPDIMASRFKESAQQSLRKYGILSSYKHTNPYAPEHSYRIPDCILAEE